jgi:hypothetical protein
LSARRWFWIERASRPKYQYARGLDVDAHGEAMGSLCHAEPTPGGIGIDRGAVRG